MQLRLGWLYGHEMNIYGDRGNVIALVQRGRWRGIEVDAETVGPGETLDPSRFDIYFWGGGQDREQVNAAADLAGEKGRTLTAALEDGVPMLAICGGYQLLGHYYRPHGGADLPGIGLLDIRSEAGHERFIGNIVIDSALFGELVGFENHSGLTFLGDGVQPLGRVRVGAGNNGLDGTSGAIYKNTIGCYLHGALLPKNPQLTDWLLTRALERKYGLTELESIDSNLEELAHSSVAQRAIALGG